MVKYYDYDNQAWVADGLYVRCGHDQSMVCNCFGRLHEGEKAKGPAAGQPFRKTDDVDADIATAILQYETGELEDSQVIKLFQRLIDNGMAWSLQGSYGRMAMSLIEAGYCVRGN